MSSFRVFDFAVLYNNWQGWNNYFWYGSTGTVLCTPIYGFIMVEVVVMA